MSPLTKTAAQDGEKLLLRACCYIVYNGKIYDLVPRPGISEEIRVESQVSSKNGQVESRVIGLAERIIQSTESFAALLQDSLKERRNLS